MKMMWKREHFHVKKIHTEEVMKMLQTSHLTPQEGVGRISIKSGYDLWDQNSVITFDFCGFYNLNLKPFKFSVDPLNRPTCLA